MAPETFAKVREQAALQLWAREHGRDRFVLLPPQADAGFAQLPEPSVGDLFFDFEGNPFWDRDGSLEYLWGILDTRRSFSPLWAYDHETERAAFEEFIDLVHERLASDPNLHVYHYAAYEITALKRLMAATAPAGDSTACCGAASSSTPRVRSGLRLAAGLRLKELEAFLDFHRGGGGEGRRRSIVMFEEWMQTREQVLLDKIAAYNEEDCIATLLLRDWLLERRAEALREFGPFPQPEPVEPKPVPEGKAERAALREALLHEGEELAAHLLDYHERERKPVWWAFFERLEKPDGCSRTWSRSVVHGRRRAGAGEAFEGLDARLSGAGA
jgi:uncharacterized protein